RLRDHVKTGAGSTAALELDAGGRIGLNPNTEVEIVGPTEVEAQNQGTFKRLVLKAGALWARVTRRKEEVQVQTSGGVMGIRGTEFVVDTTREGDTTLMVLEGKVEVTPTEGEPLVAGEGAEVTLALKKVPVVNQYSAQEIRQRAQDRFPELFELFRHLDTVLGVAGSMGADVGQARGALWMAQAAVQVVNDPSQAALDYARSQISSRVPGGFGIPISVSSGSRKDPDFPVELRPDRTSTGTEPPQFSWKPFQGASQYVLLLGPDEQLSEVLWSARVNQPSAAYPSNGQPLAAGRYYWRVIALDDKGKPKGKASQTYFDSLGWGSQAASEPSPQASTPPPQSEPSPQTSTPPPQSEPPPPDTPPPGAPSVPGGW
ncbi:MAG TPA: FecR family protein, partial [Candidatus Nitrosotenuis sp.]|nr:FecR family protein [Candidatus Nitrosotenuis sp.]